MRIARVAVAGCLVVGLALARQKFASQPVVTDAEIRAILKERVDDSKQSIGIVVGVVEERGERVVAYGELNQGDNRPLDGDTVFELGSVTSVFTSLLLADMVQRGEVTLNDPVSAYLPLRVRLPNRGDKTMTLTDLATHTAGLPLLPQNFHPKNPQNPFANFSEGDLYRSLESTTLASEPGSSYQFSNMGSALLGSIFTRRSGLSYEALLRLRILDPLGLKNTGITLSNVMKAQFAVGHDANLQPAPYWDAPGIPGAVALRSTTHDLLTFLAANTGLKDTPLAPAMALMLKTRRPTQYKGMEVALGWHVLTTTTSEVYWHNGGTGGFRAFIGFDKIRKVGVVVLSNTETNPGIDDIGFRLFQTLSPDQSLLKDHKEAKVDKRLFDSYLGVYQINNDLTMTIIRDGDHLAAILGEQKYELTPESEKDFFVKTIEGQLTFVTNRQGVAYMLVLHQAGTDIEAKRVR